MSARQGTRQAEVVEVIRTTSLVGSGTPDDIYRERIDYWTLNGNHLASVESCNPDGSEPRSRDAAGGGS